MTDRTEEELNPDERIESLFNSITMIAEGLKKPPPTTIIMNKAFFKRWHKWCRQRGLDYTRWRGHQIILDKEAPAEIAVSYHLEQEKLT